MVGGWVKVGQEDQVAVEVLVTAVVDVVVEVTAMVQTEEACTRMVGICCRICSPSRAALY